MLYFFGGAHRMGSHFQAEIVRSALEQSGVAYGGIAGSDFALQNCVQHELRTLIARYNELPNQHGPEFVTIMKAHLAFPEQIQCILDARNARFFQIWRDPCEALVSDWHFARAFAGYPELPFERYYRMRGRGVLLRNSVQKLAWMAVDDERVFHASYVALLDTFEPEATRMLEFADVRGTDMALLADSVSFAVQKQRWVDKERGDFLRSASVGTFADLELPMSLHEDVQIIVNESSLAALRRAWAAEYRLLNFFTAPEYHDRDLRRRVYLWLRQEPRGSWTRSLVRRLRRWYR